MSVPRKRQHRSKKSADVPTPITEAELTAEITDWINRLPFGGERWDAAIDSTVRILDAAKAKDVDALRKLSIRSKGGKLLKRLAWIADNRNRGRIPEPSRSTSATSATEACGTEATLEEMVETINEIGKSSGPRLQLVAICGYRELISPELATAMLNLAYDALGLPLKPEQKGGEHHE